MFKSWLLLGCALLALWFTPLPASPPPVILILGDSLSAGYGLAPTDTWPALLQDRLERRSLPHRVVNASISGDTTSGGLSRLPDLLRRHRPDILILALGGNDGLRGLPLEAMRRNLREMIRRARAGGVNNIVLLGMRMPPNYGPYADDFHRLYGEIARQDDVLLVDFFLDGVALEPALLQPDGIHPNARAQQRLLDNVWPALAEALELAPELSDSGAAPVSARANIERRP